MAVRPNQVVNSTTPPASAILTKIVQVTRSDTTAFDAFVLPKGAVYIGAYVAGVTSSDAATTAIIDVGTNPGTLDELIDSFSVKTSGDGYFPVDAAAGTALGVQLTADTLYKARYAETGTASTTGGPWLVKVEYYIPQSGFTY
jgi:hypothetical protein